MIVTLAEEVHERDQRRSWSQTDEILAEMMELVSVFRNEHLMAHGVKASQVPDPLHVPRPGERSDVGQRATIVVSPSEFARMVN